MAKETNPQKRKLTFHNKLSPNFRQVHVDGAFGGITPPGFLNLNFYGERLPIPKATDYTVNENNTLGEKIIDSNDSKNGVVREYEFGIYCDLKTAINIRNFLNDRISELEFLDKNKNAAISST